MKRCIQELKLRVYVFIVNKNPYVREAYHLPIDVDKEYHRAHRIKEWYRLVKLIWRYRILNTVPTDQELDYLERLRAIRSLLPEYKNDNVETSDSNLRDTNMAQNAIILAEDEIKRASGADFIHNPSKKKILLYGCERINLHWAKYAKELQKDNCYLVHLCSETRKSANRSNIPIFTNPFDLNDCNIFYVPNEEEINHYEEYFIDNVLHISIAVEEILNSCPDLRKKEISCMLARAYCYFENLIDTINPELIICEKKDNVANLLFKRIVEEKNSNCIMLDDETNIESIILNIRRKITDENSSYYAN